MIHDDGNSTAGFTHRQMMNGILHSVWRDCVTLTHMKQVQSVRPAREIVLIGCCKLLASSAENSLQRNTIEPAVTCCDCQSLLFERHELQRIVLQSKLGGTQRFTYTPVGAIWEEWTLPIDSGTHARLVQPWLVDLSFFDALTTRKWRTPLNQIFMCYKTMDTGN